MTKTGFIFKIAAVLNAVVLFGGYVWHRGSSVRAVDPAPPEAAASDSDTPATVQSERKEIPAAPAREALMFSSKSSGAIFQSDRTAEKKRSEILPGPKSTVFTFDVTPRAQPTPWAPSAEWIEAAEQPAPSAPPQREIPMDGSKPDAHSFTQGSESLRSEIKAVRKDLERLRQQYVKSSDPPKRQVIMSGSKSIAAPIVLDVPPEPAVKPPDPPKRRVIMAGSKSAPADFDFPQEKRPAVQQQVQAQRK